ncbi:hypothetical protein [Taibaiella koreensis]|uniref:hypothetical protein n=1 Tax=Taibaiella koreensis TaxID=1268548 RepID=UPI000E59DA20|nr:hypothetical protein [Taibaiella koreensis]
MNYRILLLLAGLGPLTLQAQEDEWKEASKESQAYHEYRMKITKPPYGLDKVQRMIGAMPEGAEDDPRRPAAKTYQSLSLREKFTYHMILGESYAQNCDVMPPIQEEQKKIFAQLPDPFDEYSWSEGQEAFLRKNRDSVLAFIRESVIRSKHMGLNYKKAVLLVNGWEMIPFLVNTYKADPKDHDILSLMLLLMKDGQYQPLLASASWKKLYGPDASYQSWIEYNKANEALILKRVMEYYQTRK